MTAGEHVIISTKLNGLGELVHHLMPEHHMFNKNIQLNTYKKVSLCTRHMSDEC